MKNIISYDEFISEDYRDVAGCGSGGKHADDNITILANGSGSSIIDVIGHPTGDKKVLGTELIKNVKGEYWRQKRDKSKRETNIEEEKKKRMRRKAYKVLSDVDTIAEDNNIITTKFADFKDEKIKKFKKTKEFEPLSDDIIALQELEDGSIEKIKGPIQIVQITGIVKEPEKVKKLEEAISGGPVFSTDFQTKDVKIGSIIYLTAFVKKTGSTSWSSQQSQCVIAARITNIWQGLNKLKYV